MIQMRVAELFAGVGGFRIGLEAANRHLGEEIFKVCWSNQWEPGSRRQHASDIYVSRFGEGGHSNQDISTVMPSMLCNVDMLVGGFPCQDYSVATTLQRSEGLAGKKGVLWWEIHRLLRDLVPRPKYLLLENVDRLLKSPATQRGRDFAVMLASLADLGYDVEWRVINAADYGMPQRRRRVFILGYLRGTGLSEAIRQDSRSAQWLTTTGVLASALPVEPIASMFAKELTIQGDLVEVTNRFNHLSPKTPFAEAGYMVGRRVVTTEVKPAYFGPKRTLGDVLIDESAVPSEFFIGEEIDEWKFLKGAKSLERTSRSSGHKYIYSEGRMTFPDRLDRPSRTIVTGEGGASPSRFKHIVQTQSGRYRRLVPVELERLNMFPDNHTLGVPDTKRAFLMGNALVTGVVQKTAIALAEWIVEAGAIASSRQIRRPSMATPSPISPD